MAGRKTPTGRDRRQFERWRSQEDIEIVHNGVRYVATVVNASAGGLAVKSDAPVRNGDSVSVAMRGLPKSPMTVVRRTDKIIALTFRDGPNYHFR